MSIIEGEFSFGDLIKDDAKNSGNNGIIQGEFTFDDLIKDSQKQIYNDNNDIIEGEYTFGDLIKDDVKISNRNDEIVEGEFSFNDLMHNNPKNNDNNYDDDNNDGYDQNEFNMTDDYSEELNIIKELPTAIERNYLSKVADSKPITKSNKNDKKDNKDSKSEFKTSGDNELDELEMEHHVLQEMRRSLIDRIKYAKEQCRISDEVIENGQKQFDFIKNNLINKEMNPVITQPPIQSNKVVSRPQSRGTSISINPSRKPLPKPNDYIPLANNYKPIARPLSAQPKISKNSSKNKDKKDIKKEFNPPTSGWNSNNVVIETKTKLQINEERKEERIKKNNEKKDIYNDKNNMRDLDAWNGDINVPIKVVKSKETESKSDIEMNEIKEREKRIDMENKNKNLLLLHEKLKNLLVEKSIIEANYNDDIHIGLYNDTIDEQKKTLKHLRFIESGILEETDRIRYMRDLYQNELHPLKENRILYNLRDNITLLRSKLMRLRRNERLLPVESVTDTIELELLRHKLRSQNNDDN